MIRLFGYNSDEAGFDERYVKPAPRSVVKCCYCKTPLFKGKNYTRDHIHPKSLGGTYTKPCCYTCNQEKGKRTLAHYILYLRVKLQLLKGDEAVTCQLKIKNANKILNQLKK